MNEREFKDAITSMSSIDFCRRHLFDSEAWVFTPVSGVLAAGTYHDFRVTVANSVDTNPNNISIIGSGKYGFSMAPNKAMRPFSKESDIDVVIVSPELFDKVWRDVRTAIHNGYSNLKSMHGNQIILRFIVLDSINRYSTKYLRDTALIIADLAKHLNLATRIQCPFKFRVYATWEDVELYHSVGISKLRENIQ